MDASQRAPADRSSAASDFKGVLAAGAARGYMHKLLLSLQKRSSWRLPLQRNQASLQTLPSAGSRASTWTLTSDRRCCVAHLLAEATCSLHHPPPCRCRAPQGWTRASGGPQRPSGLSHPAGHAGVCSERLSNHLQHSHQLAPPHSRLQRLRWLRQAHTDLDNTLMVQGMQASACLGLLQPTGFRSLQVRHASIGPDRGVHSRTPLPCRRSKDLGPQRQGSGVVCGNSKAHQSATRSNP